MRKTLVLRSSFLYYRRKDRDWPVSSIRNFSCILVGLAAFFVLKLKPALLCVGVLGLLELSDWFDKPRCLIRDGRITIKRGRHTYRSFCMDELYAMGVYQGENAAPMFFLCATSPKTMKHYAETHKEDFMLIAEGYGFDPDDLPEKEQRQVTLTLYMWQKVKKSNPTTAMICLTKSAWTKLNTYCQEQRLTLLKLSAPAGGAQE